MIEKLDKLKNFVLLEEKNISEEKNRGAIKKTETKHREEKLFQYKKVL